MSRDFGANEFWYLILAVRWTVLLSLVAFLGGAILGLAIAVMRTGTIAPLRWMTAGFIQLFQGTPVLMQLFLVYYGITVVFGLRLDPWPAVTLAFTCYAAAFLGEIWRGCIQSIPSGQWDAARALGLGWGVTMAKIVLPQALRISIPATVGFLVQLVKGTSIAAIIGFVELTRAGQLIVNVTFQPMTVYPIIALLYFAICWPLSLLSRRLEKRLDTGKQTALAGM
jgi:polar amino acid transport system permease protein